MEYVRVALVFGDTDATVPDFNAKDLSPGSPAS